MKFLKRGNEVVRKKASSTSISFSPSLPPSARSMHRVASSPTKVISPMQLSNTGP